jgi:type III secretory pathway component EscV
MAISRKPNQSSSATAKTVDVDALIKKGGSVAGKNEEENSTVPVILRVPEDLLEKVDASVQARRIKTPRHTWLLEAVLEKLERESV